ncbi:MAG: O-antigen ligase family protein [Gemmatimonadota bacterium]
MTATTNRARPRPEVDGRWFLAFLGLQILVLALALLLPSKLLYAAAAGLGAGLFLVLLVLHPWVIVPAVVATTALDVTGQLLKQTVVGVPVTGFHLALALMMAGIVANTFVRRRTRFPEFELRGPLFLLLGVMAVSLTYTPALEDGTIGLMRTIVLVAFLYGAQIIIDSPRAVTFVLISMGAAMVVGSIMAVAQLLSEKFYLPASFVIAVGANAPRATGTFQNPNTFGTFMMSGAVLLFGVLVFRRLSRWARLATIGALAVALGGLVMTFSRANWVAAGVGIAVALLLSGKLRYLWYVLVGSTLGVMAIKEFVPFADHIYQRFLSIFTLLLDLGAAGRESGSARVYFAIAGLEMWLDHPLLGAGWRAFPVLFDYYKPIDFPHWVPTKESHTLFANILAELGLVGFTASVWIVWRTLKRGILAVRRAPDTYLGGVMCGLVALFVAFQVSLSFTADFSNNFLWFFTGMIFAVARLIDQQA